MISTWTRWVRVRGSTWIHWVVHHKWPVQCTNLMNSFLLVTAITRPRGREGMLTWLKPILFMYLLGENNLWVLWLGKTLNAWISITRRNKFMRFAHWTGHFWWTIQWTWSTFWVFPIWSKQRSVTPKRANAWGLDKTLNAWISVTRRNELMRLAHWTSHF